MNNLNDVTMALQNSYTNLIEGVMNFLPVLIIALIIVIIGWILGAALSKAVEHLIKSIKLDNLLKGTGMEEALSRGGIKLNSGKFIGELIKWFTIVVFLITAFDILGLTQITAFLSDVVLGYIPQVIAAVLIILIAVIIAEALRKTVVASAKAAHLSAANFLGTLTKWAIWIVAALAAAEQLSILDSYFVQTLFTGIIFAITLALGLSFGIGGRDAAANAIEKMKKEVSERD